MARINFKISLIALVAVVLVATACKKDKQGEDAPNPPSGDGKDKITFTWEFDSPYVQNIMIEATNGKKFTVDWGDGSTIETKTGESSNITLLPNYISTGEYTVTITAVDTNCRFLFFACSHDQFKNLDLENCSALTRLSCYDNQLINLNLSSCSALRNLDCGYNKIKNLNLSSCSALVHLQCEHNQLTNLNLTSCQKLTLIGCYDNKLQLSDLYVAHLKINNQYDKYLGTQNLPSQTASIGQTLFSDQSIFGGVFTKYTVIKNDVPAPESDFAVVDGKLKFNAIGIYNVTMTNDVIISDKMAPAQVIVEITVQ